jgi:hypothetical protein
MAQALRSQFSPLNTDVEFEPLASAEFEREQRRLRKIEQSGPSMNSVCARIWPGGRAPTPREAPKLTGARRSAALAQTQVPSTGLVPRSSSPPPVSVRIELAPLTFQETAFPLENLRTYFLRERAALWWVSNQSDDLLCLPHCHIQRLEYQVRSALRVLGPLRGRALLSDEVGLGKTIEAGLVLKELLTRGMIKRFLVLTVPSLVDQWEEELSDNLASPCYHQPRRRAGELGKILERESRHRGQSPHAQATRQSGRRPATCLDLLIVDEAHYLRNRESQAWQAVNVLPRQFLLLLTATPVRTLWMNSIIWSRF